MNREYIHFQKSQNDEEFKKPNPIVDDHTKFIRHFPPPLPPKPKNLTNDQTMKKTDLKVKKPAYSDKPPTSSFV